MRVYYRCLLIIALAILPGLSGFAQEAVTRYTTANLNLRKSATTNSSILEKIPQGTSVSIEENSNSLWVPVSYNGQIGFISSKYLSKDKVKTKSFQGGSYERKSGGKRSYINVDGKRVQSPTHYSKVPAGATALCRDGTYSFSKNRRGTCSRHGGVSRWL